MRDEVPIPTVGQDGLFDRVWHRAGEHGSHVEQPRLAWLAVRIDVPLTVSAAQELVAAALAQESLISAETLKVRTAEINRFWRHLGHHQVRLVHEATPAIVDEFVQGAARKGSRWSVPAGSTQRNRRAAVRHVFEVLRGVGFQVGDPTLDLSVVEDRTRKAAPVSDAVIARLQAAAPHELVASRRAVVLALAQAGATNTEITRVARSDVDLLAGTVTLAGRTRVGARTNPLTRWGHTVLSDVLSDEGSTSELLLPISASSAAATVSNTMSDLCQAAGLVPRVSVEGIRAWRARRLFQHSASLEDVARFLGTRSLDVASDMIGHHWQVSA